MLLTRRAHPAALGAAAKPPAPASRTQAELTQAYSLLVEVFLADMGATHARENEQLMAEGRLLGRQVVELVRTRMPVCSKDLAVGGRELLELVPRQKQKYSYLPAGTRTIRQSSQRKRSFAHSSP